MLLQCLASYDSVGQVGGVVRQEFPRVAEPLHAIQRLLQALNAVLERLALAKGIQGSVMLMCRRVKRKKWSIFVDKSKRLILPIITLLSTVKSANF